jgi:hypothetical protein
MLTEEHEHMQGTVTIMSVPTLSKVSASVGVVIIVLDGSSEPSMNTASDMPSGEVGTVSPSGTAILAWNATS